MIISIILLCVTSMVHGKAQTVNIVPEFAVEETFKINSLKYSFNGVVDYLLVRLPRTESGKLSLYSLSNRLTSVLEFLLAYPANADTLGELRDVAVTGAVIRAEQDNMEQAIPRAALMIASYCKTQKFLHYFDINQPTYTYPPKAVCYARLY
jgi:hypothetical protein